MSILSQLEQHEKAFAYTLVAVFHMHWHSQSLKSSATPLLHSPLGAWNEQGEHVGSQAVLAAVMQVGDYRC